MHFYWQLLGKELPPSTLQLVQIYFDTATFDDIERDKKIKTEAQLSLIGGTMGLLTGFSIISGVEIIFFLFRLNAIIENVGDSFLGWFARWGYLVCCGRSWKTTATPLIANFAQNESDFAPLSSMASKAGWTVYIVHSTTIMKSIRKPKKSPMSILF